MIRMSRMEIESVRHKNLRKILETGKAKSMMEPERITDMVAFIDAAESLDELAIPPNFGFHPLSGNRKGTYALTVTRNRRLTFTVTDEMTIADLDLEDYHK